MADDPTIKEIEAIADQLRDLDFWHADWCRAQAARIRDMRNRMRDLQIRLKTEKEGEAKR